ncbi:glycosyltransferase [Enterococcus cecorum]|nr:glycosyltransferase [Enterococcus cecorum]CAI3498111.1 glycosyltransferase [Enterococcus cecorum]
MKDGVILYIGGFELPDKNAAAHRVLSNAKIFRELGKKVVFIGIDKNMSRELDVLDTYRDVQGFDAYAVPYPNGSKSWVKHLTDISDYIKVCEKLGNVESVILYNFQAIAMRRLMSYCKKNGIKCCADITEWRSAKGEDFVYRVLKDSDTWYRMHILHKKLDGLIVISRYLEEYYQSCKNVVYIPVLVDCSESKWKNSYNKSTDMLKLVYAGNPGRKDRLDKLIKALVKIKRNYVLDVIGMTTEQYLEYYPEDTQLLNDCSWIIFHGRLSHLETLEYVKKANYSCFLREDDRVSKAGFPTKFVEAITSGTPVLTNKTSNICDYVNKNKNGVLVENIDESEVDVCLNELPYEMETETDLFDYLGYQSAMKQFLEL